MIPEVELISNTFPAGMLLLVQGRRMMPDAFFLVPLFVAHTTGRPGYCRMDWAPAGSKTSFGT